MNTTSPIAGSKRSKRRAAKTSMGKVAYEVAKQEKRDRQLEHERVKAESTKRLANDLATASIQDIARSRVHALRAVYGGFRPDHFQQSQVKPPSGAQTSHALAKKAFYDGKKQRRELQQQQGRVKANAAKRLNNAYETAPREKIIKAHARVKGADRFGKYNILLDRLRSASKRDIADTVSKVTQSAAPPCLTAAAKRRIAWADMGKDAYYQQKQERKERQQEKARAGAEGKNANDKSQ
ncbi:hypothetical protein CLAFUW4_07010 [Fulvia fulva]|uniref:Uncharacterized protein n=1 Tax=Passalora fulva TaxID=5499 RepID=A0A9Q8PBD8_PASFU|nr:uncharacterized protein CLAFUR5_07146 [Fulvia fulva]KAK4622315.1 hypothetical protein CLAFUR4_07019 [Fulvia fulva]KAK4622780.1 hypothetical protein CLAFUR0_07017 [Fulvia fulva]UJO19357.1 hypothetical protein CLAFUR5_07146 [Fulvia fulva]WPV16557.1 hypothetical protein CLAFUW4_07010 [Fulvia fulva]WPV30751.1 hypothetical protein CLAFUW7_07010 [Fulvia fulva]